MAKQFRQWSVKYRPKDFDSVIGNAQAIAQVKRIASKQDTHAILFHGPSGSGKTSLAKILANKLTEHPSDIEERNISDESGINDIRGLIAKSKYMPRGAHRVFILDEVHSARGQPQSALLKAIEEPEHDRVVWLLCTDRPHMLDAQLLNRCYKIAATKPTQEELAKLLFKISKKEEAFPYKKEKLQRLCLEIAKVSDRVPREAIQLLKEVADSQEEFSSFKDMIINGVRKSVEKSADKTALQVLMALYSTERSVHERAEYLIHQMNDKDTWGVITRVVDINYHLLNAAAGITQGAGFYYTKELKSRDAIPSMHLAAHVGIRLAKIKSSLLTMNTSLHHFVVPELVDILYDCDKKRKKD